MLTREDVAKLGSATQASAVGRGERRLEEQCALATAQDARIIMILTTAVALAALAAVFAAGALSLPGRPVAVLAAALVALVGFTFVSGFALVAIRSRRFETSGSTPADVVKDCAFEDPKMHHVLWICELDRRVTINEVILEKRRCWLTWAAWIFLLTPPYALVVGFLASQLKS
ncbi:hypothetical protein [Caulobacter sp. S45]|uniref:hypothetical protein n=1 Tax=Caulobacter sp. S45 TaxID=1641861 RepID=UPI001575D945|nr:hypothetical protein [Caulobacter sp. S45]